VRPWQPEWVFVALALPFGLAFLILTPPFQVPDEEAHLRRAFEISEGRIIASKRGEKTGDDLPRGLDALYQHFKSLKGHLEEKTSASDIRQSADLSFSRGEREFVVFSNSAIHPPLIYLPQAAGLFCARQFSTSVLVCLYVGRAFNLLAAVVLTFLAVRITPVGKWVFTFLALTPMALTLDASLSSDASTNALSFLLVAQVFACAASSEGVLGGRSIAMTALLGAAVGFAKQMYFLLPLCYLMIPVRKLGTRQRYLRGFVVVMGATVLAVAAWGLVVRQIWSPADAKMGMNPEQQFRLMASNPLEFVSVLYRTARAGVPRLEEYVGKLGWAELRLTDWVYLPELILLAAVSVRDFGPRAGLTNRHALVAAGVVLLVSLTIAVVMHLTWDKVGAAAIALHGRYFIPIGPLAAVVIGRLGYLIPRAVRRPSPAVPAAAVLAVPLLLTASLRMVYDRYFVDTPKDAADRACVRGRTLLEEGGEANSTPELLQRARASLEDAIRIDPDHFAAHQLLGLLLVDTHPGEAAEHFRIARRLNPGDSVAAYELGRVHAGRAEFAEAIRYFRDALKLSPGNVNVENDLRAALQKERFLNENLPKIGAEFRNLAGENMVEKRHRGTAREGLYLKPGRGPVVATEAQPLVRSFEFLWRIPPPGGDEVRFSGVPAAGDRRPFYACSKGLILTKRLFIFPPARCELLADEDVSWFYQLPLTELGASELEKERAFRTSLGLNFPLPKLPE
jgi:uncharacterized membrane protein